MERRIARLDRIAPRRIRAQAAVWVTELHGPDRDKGLDARVRRWIAEDTRHAAAFELATEAWQRSGNLPGYLPEPGPHSVGNRRRARTTGAALGGMAVLCVALAGTLYLLRDDTLTTGPAEQRAVELSDGTQVSLNANSRVIVQYSDRVRKVTLASGEALFDVVKDRSRPFVVVAGNRKVIAVGTSFEVRREEPGGSTFAVTLVEGHVAVEPTSWPDTLPSANVNGVKLLNPGERLRFTGDTSEAVDSPSIERVTAWRRGQLIFDNVSLGEAAAEFNRYGVHKLAIEGPAARNLRMGGVFKIGDPFSFAQSMADTYHLRIVISGKTITLSDKESDSQ
jgi:transmembrane sensor